MKAALFTDIDGTLTTTKSGETFKQNPQDIKPIETAIAGIKLAKKQGLLIIGCSNQGGVAAGHKTLKDAQEEMKNTLELVPELESIYICTDYEGREIYRIERDEITQVPPTLGAGRKPDPGMLERGRFDYRIDMRKSYMVGDREEDKQAAIASGIKFIPHNELENFWKH